MLILKKEGNTLKLSKEVFESIFKAKVIEKKAKDSAVIDELKNVLVSSFIRSSHKAGGLYLQITQRFLTVHESNILDLFEMFEEIERQVSTQSLYIHTVNTICINPNSSFNNKNVVSIFDGQHRTIFFVMVMLGLIKKMTHKNINLKDQKNDLMFTLFNQKTVNADKFVIKYADTQNSLSLGKFLSDYEEFLFSSSHTSFKTFSEGSNNSFSETFNVINDALTKHIKKMNGNTDTDKINALYSFLNRRVSVIVRRLLPWENETIVFMDTNKTTVPFYEFEAVKMITTAFISDHSDKFDYAQKFNGLLHWIEEEIGLKESEIAHVLRFTVLKFTKYSKTHISITTKSNRTKKLSYVVKTELKSWFESLDGDVKRHIEFLDMFKQYLSAYMSLKKGSVIGSNLEGHALNMFKIYSFTLNQSGTSGDRFSYLVLEQLRSLMFEPSKFNLQEGKRGTGKLNSSLLELYRPVQVFNDLLLLEFSINGKNVLKSYEDKFDLVFIRLTELNIEESTLSSSKISKIINEEILDKSELSKERLKLNLEIKNDFNHLNSNRGIQKTILFQKEIYTYLNEGIEFYKAIEFLSSVSSSLSFEHIIPGESKATLSNLDSDLAESINECSNYWYLTTLIESDLNSLAGNHNLKHKANIFDNGGSIEKKDNYGNKYIVNVPESKMIGYETFTAYNSYEDIYNNKDIIRENTINLFIENISFFE